MAYDKTNINVRDFFLIKAIGKKITTLALK